MNVEESAERVKKWCEFYRLREKTNIDFLFSISEKDIPIEAIETLLTAYEKEKEKNKELESDIEQKNFEIKCLNSDIKNMYCEEGVIAILEDNFDLSRDEAIQILEEE